MPSLTYVGDCSWAPSSEPEPSDPPNELPITREPWIGRQDLTAAFRLTKAIGSQYLGGYIIDNTPRDNTPFPGVATVELIIARPPNFSAYLAPCSTSLKTASLNVPAISASGIIDGETSVDGSRFVSYQAADTTYTYFASGLPTAPRFTGVIVPTAPRILRSVITASAGGTTVTFSGANAPAALVSALTMAEVDKLQSFSPEPIPGTPWYRVTEVWARELQGDS